MSIAPGYGSTAELQEQVRLLTVELEHYKETDSVARLYWQQRALKAEAALAQQAGAVDHNVESVRTKMLERSAVGLAKYGVTTERGDLSHADWLKHLQEELMDAAVYIEAALASSGPGGGGEVAAPDAGDYVLATKYGDGDPGDRWAIGFYAGETPNGRHLINDGDGKSIHAGGYRRVGKITQTQGDWLWRNRVQLEQYRRGENLWELIESLSPKEQV